MFNRTRAFFSYFAAAAALALAGPSAPVKRIIEPIPNTSRKRARGLFNNLPYEAYPEFAGKSSLRVSVPQGKRLAAKRRNQLRHKRHQKG